MDLGAFVSWEDISDALPSYEEVVIVEMDPILAKTYEQIEADIKRALEEHRGNRSVISAGLNAFMLHPDRPFGLGTLHGYSFDPETGERERFVITNPPDLDEHFVYAKERRLVEEVKADPGAETTVSGVRSLHAKTGCNSAAEGDPKSRRHARRGVNVPLEARDAWYERQLKAGMQVCISHPRLVAIGMDYVEYERAQSVVLFFLKPVMLQAGINCPGVEHPCCGDRSPGMPIFGSKRGRCLSPKN